MVIVKTIVISEETENVLEQLHIKNFSELVRNLVSGKFFVEMQESKGKKTYRIRSMKERYDL